MKLHERKVLESRGRKMVKGIQAAQESLCASPILQKKSPAITLMGVVINDELDVPNGLSQMEANRYWGDMCEVSARALAKTFSEQTPISINQVVSAARSIWMARHKKVSSPSFPADEGSPCWVDMLFEMRKKSDLDDDQIADAMNSSACLIMDLAEGDDVDGRTPESLSAEETSRRINEVLSRICSEVAPPKVIEQTAKLVHASGIFAYQYRECLRTGNKFVAAFQGSNWSDRYHYLYPFNKSLDKWIHTAVVSDVVADNTAEGNIQVKEWIRQTQSNLLHTLTYDKKSGTVGPVNAFDNLRLTGWSMS